MAHCARMLLLLYRDLRLASVCRQVHTSQLISHLTHLGVYQAHYELYELSDYTHDEIAWILSLEAYCLFAGGLFVGPAHDKYGPKFLLWGGTFVSTVLTTQSIAPVASFHQGLTLPI